MDVQTAFLHGKIRSEVYIYPPEGMEIEENKVCLLKKALYGLRESPRDWYECLNEFMEKLGFERSKYDYCFYLGRMNGQKLYIIVHVDDLLICSSSRDAIDKLKRLLNMRFRMKDMGKVQYYVGIEIDYDYDKKELCLYQEKYIQSLAEKYKIENSKSYQTPMEINLKLEPAENPESELKYRNLIGALLFIANGTRPDISFATNYLSRFQNSYNNEHFQYALRILKYLYWSQSLKLIYGANSEIIMDAYLDVGHQILLIGNQQLEL